VERPGILEELTDYAQRNRVVIHTLNAQGVHPIAPGADAAADHHLAEFNENEVWYRHMSTQGMLELARATGGTYVAARMPRRRSGSWPRRSGSICWASLRGGGYGQKDHLPKAHDLKVKLADPRKLSLQARDSYYPPAPARLQETPAGCRTGRSRTRRAIRRVQTGDNFGRRVPVRQR